MAIKKARKNKADKAVQRKNKVQTSEDNQLIIIHDDENDDGCSDLKAKVVKKKKDLVKRDGSSQKGTKKKIKKNYSDIKNKAYADLPIIIESSSDSECLTKNEEICKKLKKKGKHRLPCKGDGNCEVLSKGLPRELQEANFLFRQSSKRKGPGSHGDDGECIKKGKKKKKHKPICSLTLHDEDNEVESQKQIIPNLETISQDAMLSGRKMRQILDKSNVSDAVKKKKVLDYLTAVDSEESSNRILDKGISNLVYQLQEQNYCKMRTLGCKGHQDSAAQESEEEARVKRKKWKKKKLKKEKAYLLITSPQTQENNSGVSNEILLESKSRETQLFQEEKKVGRVTKKKSVCTKAVSNHPALLVDSEDRSAVEERKKKGKKYKGIQESSVSGHSGRCENSSKQHIKKKRKRKDRGIVDSSEEEPSLKKGRLKKEAKVREDEIKVVAFKKGNCDEVNIDKSRRQALQEEIDRESGKTKVIKEEEESGNHFGQWSTAMFGSSERKAKFLRLLGGFKKSSSVSSQHPPVHATKLNMALDWNREQNLQQDLQAEFEKAVDQKHHHRGFGFQPAIQKNMWIDKNASKSIKFED